jgi:cytoskeletal protein RodZ
MSTVAEQLHTGREARKLTVYQVAETTKIRTDHIRALEEGNFNVFSAPVYIRGFVRTYATLLKLDVPQIMALLDSELGQTTRFSEPPPLMEQSKGPLDFFMLQLSKISLRKAGVLVAVIVIVMGAVMSVSAWRHHKKSDPLGNLSPGVYRPTQSGATLPVPPPANKHQ